MSNLRIRFSGEWLVRLMVSPQERTTYAYLYVLIIPYPENNALSTREDAIFRINSSLLENGMNHTRIREISSAVPRSGTIIRSASVQHLAGHRRQSRAVKTPI